MATELARIRKEIEELNQLVELWTKNTTGSMNDKMQALGLVDTGNLFKKLGFRFRKPNFEIDRVSWTAPRYGFVLPHAKKGYKVSGGELKMQGEERTYEGRKIKKGTGDTDWLFSLIRQKLHDLADKVGNNYADRAVNASAIITVSKKLESG